MHAALAREAESPALALIIGRLVACDTGSAFRRLGELSFNELEEEGLLIYRFSVQFLSVARRFET